MSKNYHQIFAFNGGRTFVTAAPIKAFVTDGKVKPTNSYYGNSQVLRPDYEAATINPGTVMISCPGGDWFIINGKLVGFSLDSRNPNDVGTFEKHFDPTRYDLVHLYERGDLKLLGEGMPECFNLLHAEWNKR
jgi:hypothetical protein